MEIRIKVESGAVPTENFFTKIGELIRDNAWYLSNSDIVIIDGIKLERTYSTIEVTKLIDTKPEVVSEEDGIHEL